MSIDRKSDLFQEQNHEELEFEPSAHHPSAPAHESFDISTTVDPSYVIALIRKLLPLDVKDGEKDALELDKGPKIKELEEHAVNLSENEGEVEAMDTAHNIGELDNKAAIDEELQCHHDKHQGGMVGEETWEECGCILWDLATSEDHAEFMVQNLILDVLLATLMVSQSPRITEISLGIIGNLACHETSRKQIASTNGLIKVIVDQLFLDDVPCLCEACRSITLCLQGGEGVVWAETLQNEQVISRILWIADNTLNLQLIEKSVGLLLATLESQKEVADVLLPPLMKLGLSGILINLFASEMSILTGERTPERYAVLDLILRTIEALSVVDGYSQQLCQNKELFQLLNELVKLPDKIEVANSCVTAAVLIANILTDAVDLASDLSQDPNFLQGIFDIYPLASSDVDARSALWSIIARLLSRVQESEMSPSNLHLFAAIFATKVDLIEDELLDHELDDVEQESTTRGTKANARRIALKRIFNILTQWKILEDNGKKVSKEENYINEEDVDKLLNICHKKWGHA
ncbi:saal1 isoform X1 [Olea europaea subsp. europaea]|uniref:Saal1 isoform X1 n=1 Tax=Olea europaea subsp. europaea TaxID=158383 RepID=A0A8S0PQ12_OLEEU|nr:saal1 isoform X1 [Olea europaea subsp. europaea]